MSGLSALTGASGWRDTAVTRLLGIELPIVLGPFGGVSSVGLAATVSNRGGLGTFGLYGFDGARVTETARQIAAHTSKPFALNLWVPHAGSEQVHPSESEYAEYVRVLQPFFEEVGLQAPQRPDEYLPTFDEQVTAALDARPAALSFVFGAPPPWVVERARELGILLIGTATTVDEAVLLADVGMDAIVATGLEAGGHRVSFLREPEQSLVGTLALVPLVVEAVDVPVIAAGGIADGRGLAAALTLGAGAAQIGTAFLATEQSAAVPAYRAVLFSEAARHTTLTRGPSGRLARGIPNRLITELEARPIAPFPVQNWLTGKFRAVAAEQGRTDLMSLWAGQSASLITHTDAVELIDALEREAAALQGD